MSEEVFQLMKLFDNNAVEMQIALQCAPVLAGLKASNLINIKSSDGRDVNVNINDKGISVYVLADDGMKMAVLLYREEELKKYLSDNKVCQMLMELGYESVDFMELLDDFAEKYREYLNGLREFPHEMGLFLGYPYEDVKGFIDNKGKNFLCSGYWKVYGNMGEKIKLFQKFQKAEEKILKNLYFDRLYYNRGKGRM